MNKSILAIAVACFFWGIATVMIFSLLPMFLVEVLHASKKDVGMIEGIAVFLAFIAKILAGITSDYMRIRKPLILIGAIGSIIVKLMFAFATSTAFVFLAKSADRFVKGIRSAPTDALIGDLTGPNSKGKAYGIKQSFSVFGSVIGGLLASYIIYITSNNYRVAFALSAIPVVIALLVLIFCVKDSTDLKAQKDYQKWTISGAKDLPNSFWVILIVAFFLMLARFSEGFLSLRGRECGYAPHHIPLFMTIYELAHALVAFFIGQIADKTDKRKLLLKGILLLSITNLVIILFSGAFGIIAGMILAGIHLGMTQGILATLISESTTKAYRGTAFSIYYFTAGFAVLIANYLAGILADIFGSTVAAFYGGLCFTLISACILKKWLKYQKASSNTQTL